MSVPSPTDPVAGSEVCVVCGKGTSNGRGYMRLYENGRPVELCCPMCLKVYEERVARKKAEDQRGGEREIGWDEKW